MKCINKVIIEATAAEPRPIQKKIIGKKKQKTIFKKRTQIFQDGGYHDIGTFVHVCTCIVSFPFIQLFNRSRTKYT